MKRILLLCLLLLLLSACAWTKPAPATAAPTTAETEITGEETTITRAAKVDKGVSWRVLDLDDEKNAAAKQWILDWQENRYQEGPAESPMGGGKTVSRGCPVVLKENGRKTTLLDRRYLGDSDNPEQDEVAWIYPYVSDVIDERYFVVTWGGWEYIAGISVYDTKEMREIPVEWDEKYEHGASRQFWYHSLLDGGLYLMDAEHGEYWGQLHLMRVDLAQLDALKPGEALKAKNLLADISHKPAEEVSSYELTPDGRWFIVADRNGLYLFDLRAKALTYLPKTGFGAEMREDWTHVYFSTIAMRDERTLYLYGQIDNEHFKSYMAEITLP